MTKWQKIGGALGAAGFLIYVFWPKKAAAATSDATGIVTLGTPTVTGSGSALLGGNDYLVAPVATSSAVYNNVDPTTPAVDAIS